MLTPKQHFDSLLNFIKAEEPGPKPFPISSDGHWFRVAWCGLTASPWTGEDGCERLMLKSTVMKIMEESEIFYNGGLKGADYPGGDLRYDSYPIKDLDQFIYDLAWCFYMYEKNISGYDPKLQAYLFSEIMRYLELLKNDVKRFKGKRNAGKIGTLLDKLEKVKMEIEAEPGLPPNVSKPQIKKEVADIFRNHIQAPGTIIAERVAELLGIFGIKRTPSAIRRKPSDKKKLS